MLFLKYCCDPGCIKFINIVRSQMKLRILFDKHNQQTTESYYSNLNTKIASIKYKMHMPDVLKHFQKYFTLNKKFCGYNFRSLFLRYKIFTVKINFLWYLYLCSFLVLIVSVLLIAYCSKTI